MEFKIVYTLSTLQKLQLPFIWLYWKLSVMDNKKSWHELKKGLEKHTCKYTIPFQIKGYKFMKCEHEGCYTCDILN